MNSPRLSIITITKDDPVGLTRSIKSVEAWRALPNVEHLVVFGGTAPAVTASNLRLLPELSPGIANAFNQGLAMALGDWIWFINGGDAAHEALDPAWLLALLANSRADIVVGGIHYDGDASPRSVPPLHRQWPLLECWLPHPATLVRRQALLKAGGFDDGYTIAMDYDLWFRLLNGAATVDVISVPLARFDPGGLSQRAAFRDVVCREEARVILRNWRPLVSAARRMAGRVIHRLLWSIRHWKPRRQHLPVHGQQ